MDKIKKIVEFYLITNTLKDKIRSGLLTWHISKDRLESVAEHVYGVSMLAIAIDSEYDFNIDIRKVVLMLVIHELEECIIGDLTPFDKVTKEDKIKSGEEAVVQILDGLVKKDEYLNLTKEFNEKKSKESLFSNYCDKLELMIQMKKYEEEGFSDMYSPENKGLIEQEWIQNLIKNGAKSISDLFFDYHIPFFDGNEVFESIAKYAQNNDIIKETNN